MTMQAAQQGAQGRAQAMRRAAVTAADVALVLMGVLIAQAWAGLAWRDLTDAQRGAIALLCALTLMLLPRGARAAGEGGWAALSRIVVAIACAGLLTVAGATWIMSRGATMSTRWIARTVLAGDAALLLGRAAMLALARRRADARGRPRRVALVGATAYGRAALDRMRLTPQPSYLAVCVFDEADAARKERDIGGVPVIGDWDELRGRIRAGLIDEVWLTLPMSHERRIQRIVRELRDEFVELRLLPDVRHVAVVDRSATDVLGMPAINLATTPRSAPELWAKFAFDRAFALAVLVPLLPVLAALAVAVKLSSPGPVLFRQRRKGVDGREFDILKFRTMRVHRQQPGVVRQASRNDARITPVGSVPAAHVAGRAAAVLQRAVRADVGGRAAPACDRTRRFLPAARRRLHVPLPRAAWHHGLGAGQRLSRRNPQGRGDGHAREVRPVLHAELELLVRHRDHPADDRARLRRAQCVLSGACAAGCFARTRLCGRTHGSYAARHTH